MKVKAKKKHFNGYGKKYEKTSGDIYEVPDAAAKTLIDSGFVVEHTPKAEKSVAKKPAGDGKG